MDVPSWHPANQDADVLRRLAMSGGGPSQRIEFNEVNTLTEAERKVMSSDESALLGGGRGLLDASDRMYLVEQTLLEQAAKKREEDAHHAALQIFRSKALVSKPTTLEVSVGMRKSKVMQPEKPVRMVVKVKKRKDEMEDTKQTKRKKKRFRTTSSRMQGVTDLEDTRRDCEQKKNATPKVHDTSEPPPTSIATSLLIEDYSSDDGQ